MDPNTSTAETQANPTASAASAAQHTETQSLQNLPSLVDILSPDFQRETSHPGTDAASLSPSAENTTAQGRASAEEQTPSTEFEWPDLNQQEQASPLPIENLPPEIQESLTTWQGIEKQSEMINGAGNVPLAITLLGTLAGNESAVQDWTPLQPYYRPDMSDGEAYAHLALHQIQSSLGSEVYQNLMNAMITRERDVIMAEAEKLVFTKLNLNPDLLDDYQQVTTLGGFQPTDIQALTAEYLKTVPAEFHQAFKAMPGWEQERVMNLPDHEAQHYLHKEKLLFSQAEKQKADQQRQDAQAAEERQQHLQTEVTRHTDELRTHFYDRAMNIFNGSPYQSVMVAGVIAMAQQHINERAQTDAGINAAMTMLENGIATNNTFAITAAKEKMRGVAEEAFRHVVDAHNPRKKGAAAKAAAAGVAENQTANINPGNVTPQNLPEDLRSMEMPGLVEIQDALFGRRRT